MNLSLRREARVFSLLFRNILLTKLIIMNVVETTIQKLAELTSERRSLKEHLKRQYEKFFLEPAKPVGSSDEFISLTAGGWKALSRNTAKLKSLIGTEGVKDLDDYFRFTAQL